MLADPRLVRTCVSAAMIRRRSTVGRVVGVVVVCHCRATIAHRGAGLISTLTDQRTGITWTQGETEMCTKQQGRR